jgi:hypothetical protein
MEECRMKKQKLLDKLVAFFNADERERLKQQEDIKHILKKLKKKEQKLKEKLADETKEKKQLQLQQEIDIIYAQRTKGVKLLQENKKGPE